MNQAPFRTSSLAFWIVFAVLAGLIPSLVMAGKTVGQSAGDLSCARNFRTFPQRNATLPEVTLVSGDSCDLIYTRDGNEIRARILVIDETEISYLACEDVYGMTYTLKRDDALLVKMANGTTMVLSGGSNADSPSPEYQEARPVRRMEERNSNLSKKFALWGLLLIGVGLFFLTPILEFIALILGIRGLTLQNKYPDRYYNRDEAVTGVAISATFILVTILIILLLVMLV